MLDLHFTKFSHIVGIAHLQNPIKELIHSPCSIKGTGNCIVSIQGFFFIFFELDLKLRPNRIPCSLGTMFLYNNQELSNYFHWGDTVLSCDNSGLSLGWPLVTVIVLLLKWRHAIVIWLASEFHSCHVNPCELLLNSFLLYVVASCCFLLQCIITSRIIFIFWEKCIISASEVFCLIFKVYFMLSFWL